jgi:hypothetical protein
MKKIVVCVAGFAVLLREDFSWQGSPVYLNEADISLQIAESVKIADQYNATCLVASGGETRPAFPNYTEAESIIRYARDEGLASTPWVEEPYARDSAENVAYSICAAVECFQSLPDRFVFASFEIKRDRFELQRDAMKAPFQIDFAGLAPQFSSYSEVNASGESWASREALNFEEARRDPLLRGQRFAKKRADRTPRSPQGVPLSEEEYRALILKAYPTMTEFLQSWWSGDSLVWPTQRLR